MHRYYCLAYFIFCIYIYSQHIALVFIIFNCCGFFQIVCMCGGHLADDRIISEVIYSLGGHLEKVQIEVNYLFANSSGLRSWWHATCTCTAYSGLAPQSVSRTTFLVCLFFINELYHFLTCW